MCQPTTSSYGKIPHSVHVHAYFAINALLVVLQEGRWQDDNHSLESLGTQHTSSAPHAIAGQLTGAFGAAAAALASCQGAAIPRQQAASVGSHPAAADPADPAAAAKHNNILHNLAHCIKPLSWQRYACVHGWHNLRSVS
jgi:hypothetical protein